MYSICSPAIAKLSVIATLFFIVGVPHVHAQAANEQFSENLVTTKTVTFDARGPLPEVRALPMKMGGASPNGHDVEVNSRYLTLDGKPWLPVMGEFHYSRYDERDWEEELLKMKAGGVKIVSTYVFWIHHEEIQDSFDWSGRRDLKRFVALCAKHDLFVFLRIGPYVHGEARNGGLPDWLVAEGQVRRNTPEYLKQVRGFYGEIATQLRGQFWKEGGPIIGIQIENEYLLKGPGAGSEHISALKEIALTVGLNAPLFTVTGWGEADFPREQVIPVFGVYPDAFWESLLKELPPSDAYRFDLRPDAVGILPGTATSAKTDEVSVADYPRLLAEAGGGMQAAYHRRPIIDRQDLAAILVTHLGSGANLYGYYMFHGGSNPLGKQTTLQESGAIDGVYDLPVISYDFQAPLGEFGQLRPSYRELKAFHFFLEDFGSLLAPMAFIPPDVQPKGADDLTTPRAALRTDGTQSFLFLNNYVRDYAMSAQKNLQFRVKLKNETAVVPRSPINVPSGAYFIWPIRFDLNGISLQYATAQLLCSKAGKGETAYFFFAIPGIAPEFSFDAKSVRSIHVLGGLSFRANGSLYVSGIRPGTQVAIELTSLDGRTAKVIVLTQEQSWNLWRSSAGSSQKLIQSKADAYFDDETLHLRSRDNRALSFGVYPAPVRSSVAAQVPLSAGKKDGIFESFAVVMPARKLDVKLSLVGKPGDFPVARRGKYNALAPTDADFEKAGIWNITVPTNALFALENVFLRVSYCGDVARLYGSGHLLNDNFYDGNPWEIGLKHFLSHESAQGFELRIAPLRKDAQIYLSPRARPPFGDNDSCAELKKLTLIPEYEAVVRFGSSEVGSQVVIKE